MAEQEVLAPSDLLNKLSEALIQVSRGDPVTSLRNELETQLRAIDVRFNGIDKATQLQHEDTVRVPTLVDRAVNSLRELLVAEIGVSIARVEGEIGKGFAGSKEIFQGAIEVVNEKITSLANVTTQQFKSIDDKFAEKDKAVSVGLSAQKESAAAQQDSNNTATRKMEDNFTKLLDQGRELLTEVRRNTELQINDIKSRLDKGEGGNSGAFAFRTERRLDSGLVVSVFSAVITVVAVIVAVMEVMKHAS